MELDGDGDCKGDVDCWQCHGETHLVEIEEDQGNCVVVLKLNRLSTYLCQYYYRGPKDLEPEPNFVESLYSGLEGPCVFLIFQVKTSVESANLPKTFFCFIVNLNLNLNQMSNRQF
jgi:hypothetical protein